MNVLMSVHKRPFQNKLKTHRVRTQRGEAIAESAAALAFLTIVAVGLVGLLENVGRSGFYIQQVSFVAEQAAKYAASLPNNADLLGETQPVVEQLAAKCGLKGHYSATVNALMIDGHSAIKVNILSDAANAPVYKGLIDAWGSAVALCPTDNLKSVSYLSIPSRAPGVRGGPASSIGGSLLYVPIVAIGGNHTPPDYSPQTAFTMSELLTPPNTAMGPGIGATPPMLP